MTHPLKKTVISAIAAASIGGQLTNIAAAAEPMDDRKTWGEYSILLDTSSIDARMKRFEENKAYRDALNQQASKDTNTGYTQQLSQEGFYSRYTIFYAVASNPEVTVEDALPFGGMRKLDPNSTYLNHNLQYIVECRDEINKNWHKNQKSLLRINNIRSCAVDKTQEAYKLSLSHPELMHGDLALKLAQFDAEAKAPNAYTKAVQKSIYRMPYKAPVNMPATFHMQLWDSVFDQHASWDQFKDLKLDQKNNAFSLAGTDLNMHTMQMQSFFDCRDINIADKPAVSLLNRQTQFSNVMTCWDEARAEKMAETHAQKSSYLVDGKGSAYHIRHIDQFIANIRSETPQPASLQKYWKPLIETRLSFDAQYPSFGSAGLRGLVTSWDAISNPKITWKDIQSTHNRNNKPVFTFLDPTTKNMSANTKFLFECRDDILPEKLPTKYREKLTVFHEIAQCWADKAATPNETFESEKKIIAERAVDVMQDLRPMEEKMTDFNGWAQDKNPIMQPYATAVNKVASTQRGNKTFVGIDKDIMTQWHALLDTNVTWNKLKQASPASQAKNNASTSFTHNMSYVLTCRDQILGQEGIRVTVETAQKLQNDILACAKPRIQEQGATYRQGIQALRSTVHFANKASDQDINLFQRIVGNPKLGQSIYDHHPNIEGQDSSSLLFMDNLDIVFNCRANVLKSTPDLLGKPLFEKTQHCAADIIGQNNTAHKRTKKHLAIAFAGALSLGGVGFLGFRHTQTRKRRKRALSN